MEVFRFCKTGPADKMPLSLSVALAFQIYFLQSFSSALPGKAIQQLGDLMARKMLPGELLGRAIDHCS